MPTHSWASPCHNSRSVAGPAFQRASYTSWAENGRPSANNSCAAEIVSNGGNGSGTGSTPTLPYGKGRPSRSGDAPAELVPGVSITFAAVHSTCIPWWAVPGVLVLAPEEIAVDELPGYFTPMRPRQDGLAGQQRPQRGGPAVEFRYLGNSGFKISEITYGNWLTHGSQVENDQAKACVRAALEAGISSHTADAYANTMAETVLGEALKGERRESLEILTKVYWSTGPGGTTTSDCPASTSWSRSMARCRDCKPTMLIFTKLTVSTTRLARRNHAGVRRPGTDGQGALHRGQRVDGPADPGRPRPCRGPRHPPDLQPTAVLHAVAGDRGRRGAGLRSTISQIVWSPIAQGVLTGKYRPGEQPPTCLAGHRREGRRGHDQAVDAG